VSAIGNSATNDGFVRANTPNKTPAITNLTIERSTSALKNAQPKTP
jgi:hypothetical protein